MQKELSVTQAQSKSETLYDQIRADILSLRLAPNTPLRLPALSDRYGIGLTPLRECMNRLAGNKLVVPEHNKGFRVTPLTRSDLLDLEHSRNAIEGAMFTYSVVHGDDAWEAGIVGAFYHLSQTPVPSAILDNDALPVWTRRHEAFHCALVAGSRSVWMHRFAKQLEYQLGRYQRFIQSGLQDLANTAPRVADHAADVFTTSMALDPHKALYEAALSRNPTAARDAFNLHTGLSITAFEDLATLMPTGSQFATTLGLHTETLL